jgi:hypothetical protein
MPAYGTPAYIHFPNCLEKFGHGHPGILSFEALVSLKLKDQVKFLFPHPVVQEAVITDLLKAGRKHVKKKPPDEFKVVQRNHSFGIPRLFTPGHEGSLLPGYGDNPTVGYGNLMGIPAKIFDGVSKSVEGLLDEGTPVNAIKAISESVPFRRHRKGLHDFGDDKLSFCMVFIKLKEVLSAELVTQDVDGNEKFSLCNAKLLIRGNSSAGDDAVHVDVVIQFLIPGMEHLNDTGLGTKIFFVRAQFQKGLGAALVKQSVKLGLVSVKQRIQLMRQSKDNVIVRCVDDLRTAFVNPQFLFHGLTVGTVAVATGIVVDLKVSAVITAGNVVTELSGLTVQDRKGSFPLDVGLKMV